MTENRPQTVTLLTKAHIHTHTPLGILILTKLPAASNKPLSHLAYMIICNSINQALC